MKLNPAVPPSGGPNGLDQPAEPILVHDQVTRIMNNAEQRRDTEDALTQCSRDAAQKVAHYVLNSGGSWRIEAIAAIIYQAMRDGREI